MTPEKDRIVLKVKLIPRSSKNEIVGFMDDGTLKIKLTSPPVEGKANQALLIFLAEKMKISSADIDIIAGKTSHTKLISIKGINQEIVLSLLNPPNK